LLASLVAGARVVCIYACSGMSHQVFVMHVFCMGHDKCLGWQHCRNAADAVMIDFCVSCKADLAVFCACAAVSFQGKH
jgi:hypothetical protein